MRKKPRPVAALQLDLFDPFPKLLKIHNPKPRTIAERRAERHVRDGAAAAGEPPPRGRANVSGNYAAFRRST